MPTTRNRLLSLTSAFLLLGLLSACGEETQETAAEDGATSCSFTADGQEPERGATPPAGSTDLSGEVPVTLETSAGTLGAVLDADAAPCTVASFVSLAEQGYYDETECHRLTTAGIFVLQCGDPTGTGTGGPGYTVPDELDRAEADGYPAGVIAMANVGQPDTGGSQFFLVYDDTQLPADYAVFGELDADGLEAVRAVAEKGTASGAPDGPPAEPVTLSSVTRD